MCWILSWLLRSKGIHWPSDVLTEFFSFPRSFLHCLPQWPVCVFLHVTSACQSREKGLRGQKKENRTGSKAFFFLQTVWKETMRFWETLTFLQETIWIDVAEPFLHLSLHNAHFSLSLPPCFLRAHYEKSTCVLADIQTIKELRGHAEKVAFGHEWETRRSRQCQKSLTHLAPQVVMCWFLMNNVALQAYESASR